MTIPSWWYARSTTASTGGDWPETGTGAGIVIRGTTTPRTVSEKKPHPNDLAFREEAFQRMRSANWRGTVRNRR